MSVQQCGAELTLITLTLWLQCAGVAALIAWIRHVLGSEVRKLGMLRSATMVVRFHSSGSFCTDWKSCFGRPSIAGGAYRHGTRRFASQHAVIRRLAATT